MASPHPHPCVANVPCAVAHGKADAEGPLIESSGACVPAEQPVRQGMMLPPEGSYRLTRESDMRTTIILDKDTERRLGRFARSRKIRNRSEAIRLAIHEAERRLDIEEILARTGRFELRHSNEELEAMEVRRGGKARPR